MNLVGARLDGKVRYRRLPSAILRTNGSRLQLKFADRLCRWAEFVIASAIQIETSQRHTLNEDFVRIILPTID